MNLNLTLSVLLLGANMAFSQVGVISSDQAYPADFPHSSTILDVRSGNKAF